MNQDELREEAQAVAWWLSPENASARRELEQRNPPLGQWLQMIEERVNAELKRRAEQEEVAMKI